ncbi:MAG: MBL fold metallo-hydrolase [Acidobacteriota bacterium]|nr:MBL fold metallo-hydrolase [Acidobacteriota bacterium]
MLNRRSIGLFGGITLLALPALAQQQDFSKVEVKAVKAAARVYMLEGAGGNIGVSVGEDGILLVDDQFEPLADKIRAAVKTLGDGRIRFIINTHWHGDHTGGNKVFGREGTIVAQANVRKRLAAGQTVFGQTTPPQPPEALPVVTFDQSVSVHWNGEEIKVIHFPSGHTDGDSVIFFTGSNVVHMGDDFFAGHTFPFVDLGSGGSVQGLAENVAKVIAQLPADVKIIPGHGPLSTLDDLKAFHAMLVETTGAVRQKMKAGKSLEAIQAEGVPEKYKDWGKGFIDTKTWLLTVHDSLAKSAPGGTPQAHR